MQGGIASDDIIRRSRPGFGENASCHVAAEQHPKAVSAQESGERPHISCVKTEYLSKQFERTHIRYRCPKCGKEIGEGYGTADGY